MKKYFRQSNSIAKPCGYQTHCCVLKKYIRVYKKMIYFSKIVICFRKTLTCRAAFGFSKHISLLFLETFYLTL